MSEFKIRLSSISCIRNFCKVVQNSIFDMIDIDASIGNYVVDAKSALGVFTLDASKIITVTIHSDDDQIREQLIQQCRDWIVK